MDLVDRYLSSVKQSMFLVPRAQRSDILTELTESLRSDMEAKEAEVGRALTDNEREAILERYGHPLLVAGRYRGDQRSVNFGRQLIGPELFPLYIAVLTLNVTISAFVVGVIKYFTDHTGIGGFFTPLLTQFVIVTSIFIAADFSVRRSVHAGWNPKDAVARDPLRIPRASSVFEIGSLILIISAWLDIPKDLGWSAGPTWVDFRSTFYVPLLLLLIAALAIAFVNLFRAHWTPRRLAIRTAVNAAFVAMIAVKVFTHSSAAIAQGRLEIIDSAVWWTMLVTAIAILGQIVYDLVRLRRMTKA